jgi:hypothetical protein
MLVLLEWFTNDITIVGNKVTVYQDNGNSINITAPVKCRATSILGMRQTSGSNSLGLAISCFKVYSEDFKCCEGMDCCVTILYLPDCFTLSKLTINENQAIGTVVGDLMYIERRESFSDLTLARWRFFDNASFEIIQINRWHLRFWTKSVYKTVFKG